MAKILCRKEVKDTGKKKGSGTNQPAVAPAIQDRYT